VNTKAHIKFLRSFCRSIITSDRLEWDITSNSVTFEAPIAGYILALTAYRRRRSSSTGWFKFYRNVYVLTIIEEESRKPVCFENIDVGDRRTAKLMRQTYEHVRATVSGADAALRNILKALNTPKTPAPSSDPPANSNLSNPQIFASLCQEME
jgi:hypothetical protein